MNKNRKRWAALIVTVLLAAFLAACSSGASSTIGPDGASYDLKGLNKGTFLENTVRFNFDEGIIRADLESGTVDIEIINIVAEDEDPDSYTEMEMIYEGKGLGAGSEVEVSGLKTDVVIRVYGDNASGKLTISPKK